MMESPSPDLTWQAWSTEILTGMRDWRQRHPHATLTEIETALDERWYRVRARLLEDLALESRATEWAGAASTQRPTCPDCGRPLLQRGQQPRHLKTHGGQELTLRRSYGVCPACQKGFFPPR
jgi:hypothetical protein